MRDGYYYGLDVSSVQATIDFSALSNIEFLIAKCGNGNDGIDPTYANNYSGAVAAGLTAYTYHFVFPIGLPSTIANPNRTPEEQAEYHFTACLRPAACDLEWPPVASWAQYDCSASQINDWGLRYCERYKSLAGSVMLYTFPDFANSVGFTSDWLAYPLWAASYAQTPLIPKPWEGFAVWQTSGGAYILPNGIRTDTNLCPDLSVFS
jgi:GH25 family lysozyme M1 (1,4-beta-N-acetylmuramidase)